MTVTLPNSRQQVWVSRVLEDDHYRHFSHVTVGVSRKKKPYCLMTMSREYRSISETLQRNNNCKKNGSDRCKWQFRQFKQGWQFFLYNLFSVGCEAGKYGVNCTMTCSHCKNNASCGQEDGKCNDEGCAYSGYQTPNCQSKLNG